MQHTLNLLKITTLYSPHKKHSITNQSHFNNKIDLYPKKNLFLDPQQVSPVHNLKREKTLDLFSERFSHSRTWYRDGRKGTFDSLISPGDVMRIRYTSASPIHSICLHYLVDDKVERWWSAFFSALVPFATRSLGYISYSWGTRAMSDSPSLTSSLFSCTGCSNRIPAAIWPSCFTTLSTGTPRSNV